MMVLFSVGLPLLALAALIPVHLAFETLLNHFPAVENAFEKASTFNPFQYL